MSVAETDSRQTRSFRIEFGLMGAQLRHVLAAEDSAIVTEKSEHAGLRDPEGSQPDFASFAIRKNKFSELAAQRCLHDKSP